MKEIIPHLSLIAASVAAAVAGLLGAAARPAIAAADLPLTKDGRPVSAIVISAAASEAAQFAAFEFQETLRVITGAEVPIVSDKEAVNGTKIFVGESEATRNLGLKSADFEPQEYLVRFLPDAVVLIGRDLPYRGLKVDYADFKTYPDIWGDMATCHAVYDFLERHCGVRWYAPGELGTVADRRATLSVRPAAEDVRRKPRMVSREIEMGDAAGRETVELTGPDDAVTGAEWNRWIRRLRLGGELFKAGHSTGSLYFYHWDKIRPDHHWSKTAPMKDWFQGRRPELFAKGYEKDPQAWSGMRDWFTPGDPVPPQPCLSEPGTLDFFTKRAREYFDSGDVRFQLFQGLWTGGAFFPFHWDDNAWYCKCPACEAQFDPTEKLLLQDGKGHGRFSNGYASNHYFAFVNRLARETAKSHPGRSVSALAYWHTARHPTFDLEPNIAVQLCIHPRNCWCPASRTNETDIYDEWIKREKGKRPLYLWLYYLFPVEAGRTQKFTPFPGFFARQVAADWNRYAEDGIRGYFIQSSWALPATFCHDQLELHLVSKLSDDPSLDGGKLIDEFFTRSYGVAAKPMRAFYELVEKTYTDSNNYPKGIRNGTLELHQSEEIAWQWLGTASRMEKLQTLMAEAKAAATTDLEKRRIARFERGIWLPMVEAAARHARK